MNSRHGVSFGFILFGVGLGSEMIVLFSNLPNWIFYPLATVLIIPSMLGVFLTVTEDDLKIQTVKSVE